MANSQKTDIDDTIKKLLEARNASPGKIINLLQNEIRDICLKAREIFLSQPVLLELEAPISVCGDIHGQYYDLLRLFEYNDFPPEKNYLFLGNYVDFGKQSIETICLLLAYKIKYPENFFLLRGNHECARINRTDGFYDECKGRYDIKTWKLFDDCFNVMPVAAIIDEKIFCCHGGLSPDLESMDQIKKFCRPSDVPDTGLFCDLLWSKPDKGVKGWRKNDSGVSFVFGEDVIEEFLKKHDMDLICCGNEMVEDGYEIFARKQFVTLFSAPRFKDKYDNAAAIMNVDESLLIGFKVLRPSKKNLTYQTKLKDSPEETSPSSEITDNSFDIFLSYAWNEHKDKVLDLYNELSKTNKIWIDHKQMLHGDVSELMKDGVKNSTIFMCCLSVDYTERKNTRLELNVAVARDKPIVWVIFDNIENMTNKQVLDKYTNVEQYLAQQFYYKHTEIDKIKAAIQQIKVRV